MAGKKRRTAKKKTAKRSAKRKHKSLLLRRILKYGFLSLTLLLVFYIVYLDFSIRHQFEGRRWSIPARVYARPLEIYPGMPITTGRFRYELGLMNYQVVGNPQNPGTWALSGDTFVVKTRRFVFWDGEEPSRHLRIRFANDAIVSIEDIASGKSLDLVRLDPALIGSFYPGHHEDRVLVKLDKVPKLLTRALIAIEDKSFYRHYGVTMRGIGGALWANLKAGKTVRGGSTLTQQLAKNYFLSNERTLTRKAKEAIMALLLELHYDKQDILESYLNEVYLGQDGRRSIHGFGLASHFYFNRPLDKLAPEQLALLVGLVKGPSWYDPRRHPARALKRRNLVLSEMVRQKILSKAQGDMYSSRVLGVVPHRRNNLSRFPAFMDLVRRQLQRDYKREDLVTKGLRIFTTMDPYVQQVAEQQVSARIRQLESGYGLKKGKLQTAVVITRTDNAEVLAVVGDRRPRYAGFNRALDAVRQVGSLIKPGVYLAALSGNRGYTLATLLDDDPLQVKNEKGETWVPKNYDKQHHGKVPMFLSLVHSYNVSTVRLGMAVGVNNVITSLRKMGVYRYLPAYPSLFLGSARLSPIEVTQMYQTIATGGFRTPVRSIRAVLTSDHKPLTRYPLTVEKVFSPVDVYLLTRTLQQVVRMGTAKNLSAQLDPSFNIAGKTGTTDDLRDSWFAGFSQNYLAVVWVGMDDNQPTRLTGSTGALRVFGDIFRQLRPGPLELVPPGNIEQVWVDPASGKRVADDCENAIRMPFVRGTAPTEEVACPW